MEMKQKEFEAFYDDVVHQIALRTTREVFVADYALRVEAVVFNGWVRGVDRKTGAPFTWCVLSCGTPHESRSWRSATWRSWPQGVYSEPQRRPRGAAGYAGDRKNPIMELKRDDDRFVESKEVLEPASPGRQPGCDGLGGLRTYLSPWTC